MAMTIVNNPSAMLTLGELNKNVSKLGKELKKVASGERITGAGDDPSGYAISEEMRVKIRALGQADRNTQTGTALLRTAEGAIQSQIEILKTIKDKVLDANNDTNTDVDRATIQKEIDQGYQQMENIAWETNYNGILLLCGGDPKEMKHTNWAEEKEPEFGVCDNDTTDINLITPMGSDAFHHMKQQAKLGQGVPAYIDSVYDEAKVYNSSTIDTVNMAGGKDWKAQKTTVTLNTSGMSSEDDVVKALRNKTFEVTLNKLNADGTVASTTTEKFTFADDLTYNRNYDYSCDYDYSFKYDYNESYIDEHGDPQTRVSEASHSGSSSGTSTVASTLTTNFQYNGTTTISLKSIQNAASGVTDAADRALAALANAIAAKFGSYDVDGSSGSASQAYIYGDSVSGGSLTLASGDHTFSVTSSVLLPTNNGVDGSVNVTASRNAAQSAASADAPGKVLTRATNIDVPNDMTSGTLNPAPIAGSQRDISVSNVRNVSVTVPTSFTTSDGGATFEYKVTAHQSEQFAYTDIDLTNLMDGATTIDELIDKFQFKEADVNIYDTGNNLVVDKSFTIGGGAYGSLTFEFVDSARENTGSAYLYDEQKVPGSIPCYLSNLRTAYNTTSASDPNRLRTALAKFLYSSLNQSGYYTSYGRNRTYSPELVNGSTVTQDSASADKIRLYAYRPYQGTNSRSTSYPNNATKNSNLFNHSHYENGRYSGTGTAGNTQDMTTGETYLCSYDLDLKQWWEDNIGDPDAAGSEATEKKLQERLNQRGFRIYCGEHNNTSTQTEWVNIYFTDRTIEEDVGERPKAGENMDTSDMIDTIKVDLTAQPIRTYKDLVNAIYKQANQSIDDPNTDWNSHFQFAMDQENGLLTIWDTDRYAHGSPMFVSDGVYDNVRLEYREIQEKRLIIHDTDHSSQAICTHIPRTTMDYVFNFNPEKDSLSNYTVLRKDMREKMLGKARTDTSSEEKGILDRGLDYLTSANCLIGAQISRLEASHNNLTVSIENTTNSESTMRDADMAKEMAEYTKANVLAQAAQSMLAQANQNSSGVISLLQ